VVSECCQEAHGDEPVVSPILSIPLMYGKNKEPTSGLEPLTCSLRVGMRLSQGVLARTGAWLAEGEYSAAGVSPVLLRTGPYQPGCGTRCSMFSNL
jgi:hypothetical protein